MVSPLLASIIGSIVRAVLIALGTFLTQHGALTADQAAQFTTAETVSKVAGWLMMAGALAWSVWQKQGGIKQIQAALHIGRPDASQAEIKARAAQPDIAAADLKAGPDRRAVAPAGPILPPDRPAPEDPRGAHAPTQALAPPRATHQAPINFADVLANITARLITIEQQGDTIIERTAVMAVKIDTIADSMTLQGIGPKA